MIAVRTSSKVVGAESVACHPLLRIVQLFNFAVFTTLQHVIWMAINTQAQDFNNTRCSYKC